MKNLVSLIFVGLILFGCANHQQDTQELIEHPNVLFISIDDLNDWVGPLAGNSQTLTPSLDRLASESVNFRYNYCASPGCNPSRTALMTGLHTYSSGMYSNYQDWRDVPKLQEVQTLGQHFRNDGYYTAGAGKIFHYQQVDTLGWDDYFPSIKRPMPREVFPAERPASMPPFKHMYGMFDWGAIPEADSATSDYRSVEYISDQLDRDHDKPFFLALGIYRPHLPWYVPQEYFDRFPLDEIELPKLLENDTSDLGVVAKELIERGGNYHKHVVEADLWKEAIQGYLASVAYADAMVGLVLDNLKKSKYADNTIVVLWSDHGWQLGEKMHWRKFALWENVIRTVMMMKVPKGIQAMPDGSKNGFEVLQPTSLMDIYPTLVELCNLTPRNDLDGQSLVSALEKPEGIDPRPVVTTYDYGSYSIRYENWHMISYVDGSSELYDLDKDPNEWTNLSADKAYEGQLNELKLFIPSNPIDLPEESLIELMEHHIPPIKSAEYYHSDERKQWMDRFKN